ncbi:MAG: terminase family protein [Phycisphaerae bacterium]
MDAALRWWTHQQAWLADRSRFRLCLKARQIGMSTVVAAEALRDAVAGQTTILASASERQSQELMRRCLKLLPLVSAASGGAIRIIKETSELLELSTGGRVLSVPASAATIQGFAGSVVLDEAAWMPNADELWQALVPSISGNSQHRLSVLSTPRGKGGLFHRLWMQADGRRWSRHRITIDDAVAGGCHVDRAQMRAAVADELTWRACYLCEFVDEQYSLLPYELLEARSDPALPYRLNAAALRDVKALYGGFDVGRKHDLSVLAIVERRDEIRICRGFVELRAAPFDQQQQALESVLALPGLRRICVDASGLGLQLSEQLARRYASRVEALTISAPLKEDLAMRMQRAFQVGEIAIPAEPELLRDLHSVERQVTAAGNVRYAAPRDASGHADRFMALALALHAALHLGPRIYFGPQRDFWDEVDDEIDDENDRPWLGLMRQGNSR